MKRLFKDKQQILSQVEIADSFIKKGVGLLKFSKVPEGYGMYFPNERAIHMWGMRSSIDVVFVKETRNHTVFNLTVLKTIHNVRAWKLLPVICLSADGVLEATPGFCAAHNIKEGDVLCID